MKTRVAVLTGLLLFAGNVYAEEIGGKFAFGFEQGINTGVPGSNELGKGLSFKLCLSNVVAIKGVLGLNYSQKAKDTRDSLSSTNAPIYVEDQDRLDYAFAAYGILVLRRFEKVHLNGITGILIAMRSNHFKDPAISNQNNNNSYDNAKEDPKRMDFRLRLLMAPEIFIFPNFTLEYKYGFDVSIRKDPIPVIYGVETHWIERSRLYIAAVGDLDLVNSASVHFYF